MKANKFYILILVVFLFQFGGFSSYAQVGIKLGTGTTFGTKTPSAVLDLGTGIQGLLLPKVALTSKTSQSPLVGASFAAAAPAGMTVYNTATAGTAPNNVTPGVYYSDGATWNRNEEIIASNGLTKNAENIELGGTLSKHTTIAQNGFNFILKPSTASGMTFAAGNNTANNRIFMPTDGLEIQSNEVTDLTKPILKVMNTGILGGEKFRVQSDGKVGIGTENNSTGKVPTDLLHLYGGSEGAETVLLNLQANAGGATTQGTGVAIRFSPTNPLGFNLRGAEIAGVNQGGNAIDLIFRTTSATSNFMERMKIMSSGEVGIGTSTPSSKLHVAGTVQLDVMSAIDTEGALVLGRADNSAVRFSKIIAKSGSTAATSFLAFDVHDAATTNSVTRAMLVRGDGNVGIGTSTPSSTLQTNGTIAVTTGTTTANSVILSSTNVTLPTASTCSGRIYMIRNTGTVAISVSTIIAYNSTTAAAYSLTAVEGAITVVSNGTNWYRIQ
jgi:hypothetical protein